MERKIGEVFSYKGKIYQVVKSTKCIDCAFRERVCSLFKSYIGQCTTNTRSDKTSVIFKEIKGMEIKNNQLTINIPKGMEIDVEHSDLSKGIVKLKPKNLTYEDILQAYAIEYGSLVVSSRNIDKLLAVSKLMDIAKYYNGDWKPDWDNGREKKCYIAFDTESSFYEVRCGYIMSCHIVYFKNMKDAQAVIDNPNFRSILDTIYKN